MGEEVYWASIKYEKTGPCFDWLFYYFLFFNFYLHYSIIYNHYVWSTCTFQSILRDSHLFFKSLIHLLQVF